MSNVLHLMRRIKKRLTNIKNSAMLYPSKTFGGMYNEKLQQIYWQYGENRYEDRGGIPVGWIRFNVGCNGLRIGQS
jgi:hypothetical protein